MKTKIFSYILVSFILTINLPAISQETPTPVQSESIYQIYDDHVDLYNSEDANTDSDCFYLELGQYFYATEDCSVAFDYNWELISLSEIPLEAPESWNQTNIMRTLIGCTC